MIHSRQVCTHAKKQDLIWEVRKARLPILSDTDFSLRIKGKIGMMESVVLENALSTKNTAKTDYSKKKAEIIDSMVKEYHVERIREGREQELDRTPLVPEKDLKTSLESREKKLAKIVSQKSADKK
jgi:hypothetical protein